MKSFLVTGTDTGVGKTYVSCLLLKALRALGHDVAPYKPVACGDREDPRLLREAGPEGLTLEQINPLYYKSPASPFVAARFENTAVDFDRLAEGFDALAARHEAVLVEGVGGWEVPMTATETFGDFARRLGLPVVLVVGNKLGALNHAILTVNAIRARGLDCAGIVFNSLSDEWDAASITNRGIIEGWTGLPVLAELIHGQDEIDTELLLHRLG